jgi:hypothetical protein
MSAQIWTKRKPVNYSNRLSTFAVVTKTNNPSAMAIHAGSDLDSAQPQEDVTQRPDIERPRD